MSSCSTGPGCSTGTLGAPLPPPRAVSPLIRFGRWAALLTGVLYGSWRLGYLTRREVNIKVHEDKIRAKHSAMVKAHREHAERDELIALAKDAGANPEDALAAAGYGPSAKSNH